MYPAEKRLIPKRTDEPLFLTRMHHMFQNKAQRANFSGLLQFYTNFYFTEIIKLFNEAKF